MDDSVTFDPHKLTLEERKFILDKIEANSQQNEDNQCKLWTKKASKNGYPQMKTNSKIAAKFGNADRPFNPSSLLYSLTHNFILFKVNNLRMSHICHNKFCVNIDHIIMEPLATNIQRNSCRDNHRCSGHGTSPFCLFQ